MTQSNAPNAGLRSSPVVGGGANRIRAEQAGELRATYMSTSTHDAAGGVCVKRKAQ